MKTVQILFIAVLGMTGLNAQGAWQTDYRVARAKAQRENKAILINFTGSDWCGWCQKLKAEVFEQSAFKSYARDNLILLEVDFPHRKRQSVVTKNANSAMASRFRVKGYPTIVLLDSLGDEIGRTGYRPGGAPAYIEELIKIVGPRRGAPVVAVGGSGGSALPRYTDLELKSITGRKRRLAMLNDTTFSEGEAARVRLGDKKVMVRCVAIKEKSVVVAVGDEEGTREIPLNQ